jgi:hypothetical protein
MKAIAKYLGVSGFYRLVQQAVAVEPVSYNETIHRGAQKPKSQYVGVT